MNLTEAKQGQVPSNLQADTISHADYFITSRRYDRSRCELYRKYVFIDQIQMIKLATNASLLTMCTSTFGVSDDRICGRTSFQM